LRSQLHGIRSQVLATDKSCCSVWAQIWSMITMFNPPSLWVTINPSDMQNPIAQVFCRVDIDLDNFRPEVGPNSTMQFINVASDSYAVALFFHFMIETTLETLYGFQKGRHGHPQRTSGMLGLLQGYIGMVE
ncbi:hypothetical protein GYMLUDRAFT_123970, partial [Collybiopsis luxurians FD-317 M1]